jgi:hypothetical protein
MTHTSSAEAAEEVAGPQVVDELLANWDLAVSGEEVFRVEHGASSNPRASWPGLSNGLVGWT